jgi:hypothetical protein
MKFSEGTRGWQSLLKSTSPLGLISLGSLVLVDRCCGTRRAAPHSFAAQPLIPQRPHPCKAGSIRGIPPPCLMLCHRCCGAAVPVRGSQQTRESVSSMAASQLIHCPTGEVERSHDRGVVEGSSNASGSRYETGSDSMSYRSSSSKTPLAVLPLPTPSLEITPLVPIYWTEFWLMRDNRRL